MLLTDQIIAELLAEPKRLPDGAIRRLRSVKLRPRCREARAVVRARSDSGHYYSLFAQRPLISITPNKFSVHLRYHPSRYAGPIILIRCNGWHPPHHNVIEELTGTGVQVVPALTCHIHTLTERYQQHIFKNDGYAEPTIEYDSFDEAIRHLCRSYGFYAPPDPSGQLELTFPE